MHDTHLLKSILKYLEDQEDLSSRKIKKVCLSISEFGSLSKEHLLEHFKSAVRSSRWQNLEVAVRIIPFGPELEITGIEFAAPGLIGEAGTRFCAGETEEKKK
jgi:Zn finger protein HypA/HybF involved in hydrogenase expression